MMLIINIRWISQPVCATDESSITVGSAEVSAITSASIPTTATFLCKQTTLIAPPTAAKNPAAPAEYSNSSSVLFFLLLSLLLWHLLMITMGHQTMCALHQLQQHCHYKMCKCACSLVHFCVVVPKCLTDELRS